MNKWIELLLGLLIVVVTMLAAWSSSLYNWMLFGKEINFLHAAWLLLQGGVFWLVFFIGLLFVLLGLNDLRE